MAIVLDGTNGITTPDLESAGPIVGTTGTLTALTVNANNISAVNSLGFRNRIINGDMRIDQRNNGASVTPILGTFIVDRWAFLATQTSKATAQQNAGSITPPAGFANYLGCTSSSAYAVLSSDTFGLYQHVEGFNSADLGWGTANAQAVTLSFWVRSSLTGTFSGAVANSAENRSYVFNYTISAANTWELKTVSIAGDTSGTWLTTNGIGLRLRFGLGSGATYTTTAGSWGAGNFVQSTGSVSVVGTSGATFYITGVQLEAGTVASPFERRDYGRELAMCQRYFQKLGGVAGEIYYAGYITSSGFLTVPITFPAMRASPTGAVVGTWAVSNVAQPILSATSPSVVSIFANGLAIGQGQFSSSSATTFITLASEL